MGDESTAHERPKRRWVRTTVVVLVVLVAVPLIAFNLEETQVWIFGLRVTVPLFLILILMFVLGMLLGGSVRAGFRKLRNSQ